MQFKSLFITLASAAAVAVAAPAGILDAAASVDASSTTANVTLTTALTTDTFTASKVLQSFMKVDPFVTTITTNTVWTVTHSVTRELPPPTGTPVASASVSASA
ncbi:uncharacterized protein TRAVEDRAFT_45188 [Trametes versicolor FP-101664 SS1]|uniref:uncharacterized protein n=1 Tax=Trametes versicolor (strain FP-101664) TaxID=717944 RepID=UPI00046234F3|nr:uncharacterized protein TRAVEDRAFT_45188 [Trametes versicolor FP-101664 SS1]EIW62367.1 hypothetical protein TRAVEDRAFT_45188 [Trametes versicolor FP-101664 SS1]